MKWVTIILLRHTVRYYTDHCTKTDYFGEKKYPICDQNKITPKLGIYRWGVWSRGEIFSKKINKKNWGTMSPPPLYHN